MSTKNSIPLSNDAELDDVTSRNHNLEPEPDNPQIDLQLLTDKVYQLMQREVRLECARNGEILWRR